MELLTFFRLDYIAFESEKSNLIGLRKQTNSFRRLVHLYLMILFDEFQS
jgi:hypothetical protein